MPGKVGGPAWRARPFRCARKCCVARGTGIPVPSRRSPFRGSLSQPEMLDRWSQECARCVCLTLRPAICFLYCFSSCLILLEMLETSLRAALSFSCAFLAKEWPCIKKSDESRRGIAFECGILCTSFCSTCCFLCLEAHVLGSGDHRRW